jgi:hypothetical protein
MVEEKYEKIVCPLTLKLLQSKEYSDIPMCNSNANSCDDCPIDWEKLRITEAGKAESRSNLLSDEHLALTREALISGGVSPAPDSQNSNENKVDRLLLHLMTIKDQNLLKNKPEREKAVDSEDANVDNRNLLKDKPLGLGLSPLNLTPLDSQNDLWNNEDSTNLLKIIIKLINSLE